MKIGWTNTFKLFALICVAAFTIQCDPSTIDVPPEGGIRVQAVAPVIGIGGGIALPPIPNTPHHGQKTNTLGPGAGSQSSINGLTNAEGISDYPLAITNAIWEITVGPTTVPPCTPNLFIEEVPYEGATFIYQCKL
jgi:hypothetical protein